MKYLFVLFFSLSLLSCKDKAASSKVFAKSISFTIDGMSCEVGCAGLLERKLKKADGVISAKINFEAKEAQVSFDSTKTTSDKVVKIVTEAADGIYKVSNIKNVN